MRALSSVLIRLALLGPLGTVAAEFSFGVDDLIGDLGLRARWLLREGVSRVGLGLAEAECFSLSSMLAAEKPGFSSLMSAGGAEIDGCGGAPGAPGGGGGPPGRPGKPCMLTGGPPGRGRKGLPPAWETATALAMAAAAGWPARESSPLAREVGGMPGMPAPPRPGGRPPGAPGGGMPPGMPGIPPGPAAACCWKRKGRGCSLAYYISSFRNGRGGN